MEQVSLARCQVGVLSEKSKNQKIKNQKLRLRHVHMVTVA